MAQQTSFVQEGVDRFNAARDRIDGEIERVQKEFQARRKRLERELRTNRRNLEKRTRKQMSRIQTELRKNPIVKQVDEFRQEASKQVEGALDSLFGALQVASKSDVERLNRKLNQINRKLKDIESSRATNGHQAPAARA